MVLPDVMKAVDGVGSHSSGRIPASNVIWIFDRS